MNHLCHGRITARITACLALITASATAQIDR